MDVAAPPRITAEQLLEMGDIGRAELIDGEIVRMSPCDPLHAAVEGAVAELVRPHVRRNRLGRFFSGELGIITRRNPDRVRGADAAVVLTDRLGDIPRSGYLPFVPELVIEIVSIHDRWSEIREKVDEYLEGGARLVWVIDPRRRVAHVYRPGQPEAQVAAGQALAGEDVLPGLEVSLDALFED